MLWVGSRTRAGAMDPLLLSSLEWYLLGDQGQGANGAGCATWNDLSPNARHATQATAALRPINRDGQSANGLRRMLEFNGLAAGNGSVMTGPLPAIPTFPSLAAGGTIYCYYVQGAVTVNAQQLFGYGVRDGTGGSAHFFINLSKAAMGVGLPDDKYALNDGNTWEDTTASTALGAQFIAITITPPPDGLGGSMQVYRDGVTLGNVPTTSNYFGTDFQVGFNVGGDSGSLLGYIGCYLGFSTLHNATIRAGVQQYFETYFEGA